MFPRNLSGQRLTQFYESSLLQGVMNKSKEGHSRLWLAALVALLIIVFALLMVG